jgi:acetyl esterase/lipase
METVRKLIRILFTFIILVMLLISLGTLIPAIPAFGSVSNFITVAYMHLWLPLCGFMFLLSLILSGSWNNKNGIWKLNAVMAMVSLLISGFLVIYAAFTLRMNKLDFVFWPEKEDVSGVNVETFTYAESERGPVDLNVYYVDDGKTDKPVMVYIHGGGWVQSDKTAHTYYSDVFAKNGYVVVSMDYDLSSEELHLAGFTENQVAEAFGWVRDNISRFGGKAEDLFVTGGSAGASMALNISYRINSGDIAATTDGIALPRIKAVSVNFPACSMEEMFHNDDLILGKMAHRMTYSYTGCSPEQDPALYESLDPITHVTKQIPATCIFYGTHDTLVPQEAMAQLARKLGEMDLPVWTVAIPYGNHMYDMVEGGFGCRAYLEGSLRWFEENR